MLRAAAIVLVFLAMDALQYTPDAHNYNLAVTNDVRKTIGLGTFGYSEGGGVAITVDSFSVAGLDGAGPIPRYVGFAMNWSTRDSRRAPTAQRHAARRIRASPTTRATPMAIFASWSSSRATPPTTW